MATSKKQDLEIHFLSLELAPALKPPRHSNHLLTLRLVCPRPTIAYKAAERTVTLADGVFAPESPKWTESVIFKETVSGRFGFAVEVTEPLSDAAAEAFVSTSASALVKFLAGFVGATFPVAELADIAEIPLSSLAKAVSKDKSVATVSGGVVTGVVEGFNEFDAAERVRHVQHPPQNPLQGNPGGRLPPVA